MHKTARNTPHKLSQMYILKNSFKSLEKNIKRYNRAMNTSESIATIIPTLQRHIAEAPLKEERDDDPNWTYIWYEIEDTDAGNECSLWSCNNQAVLKRVNLVINKYMYICSHHRELDLKHDDLYTRQIIRESKITRDTVKKAEDKKEKEVEDKNVINPKYVGGNGTSVYDPRIICSLKGCGTAAEYKRKLYRRCPYYLCGFDYLAKKGISQCDYSVLKNEDCDEEAVNRSTKEKEIEADESNLTCSLGVCDDPAAYKRKDNHIMGIYYLCDYHYVNARQIQGDYVPLDTLTNGQEILIKADKRTKAKARKNKHVTKKTQIITRSEKKKQKLQEETDTGMEEQD